ncbi:hypothetical protein [Pseudoalteromonas sp. S16_S37]|uniref:hypothetical protein n=1 Tax=Pseudoalteromonas sp. S16_S37 TaxID=2720228 RepID=UPI0016810234|nr:hypothetical protein [Pseudoalteromonas sp. S16_S37]MBD1584438.1 hypothetical protein [Pseudoalteromonas sp. S16_S37]
MATVYFNRVGYQKTENLQTKEPRERYLVGLRGLYQLYDLEFDESSVIEGDQFNYIELLEQVSEEFTQHLASFNPVIISQWGNEFDSDAPAIGPFMAKHYGLNIPVFDVIDRGSISPLIALRVLKGIVEVQQQDGALISFQQNTSPSSIGSYNVAPKYSGTGYVSLTAKNTGLAIKELAEFSEKEIHANPSSIHEKIKSLIIENELQSQEVNVFSRKGSRFNKLSNTDFINKSGSLAISYNDLPADASSLTFFSFLEKLRDENSNGYYLYVEEDFETLSTILVFIQVEQDDNNE